MKVVVFGATGKMGGKVVKQALEKGYSVTAYMRNPGKFLLKHPKLTVIQGNLTDLNSLSRAITDQDVVISVLGNKTTNALWKSNTSISAGVKNIILTMEKHHVLRLLFVTSFGVNKDIFLPGKIIIKLLLKNIFADIPLQEKIISHSTLQWTIVRPARLVDTPRRGEYKKAEHLPIGIYSSIARADVADFLLTESIENQFLHKTVTLSY